MYIAKPVQNGVKMNEIVYFAEIEIYQPETIKIEQLERLEDSIFEAQENIPEEEYDMIKELLKEDPESIALHSNCKYK